MCYSCRMHIGFPCQKSDKHRKWCQNMSGIQPSVDARIGILKIHGIFLCRNLCVCHIICIIPIRSTDRKRHHNLKQHQKNKEYPRTAFVTFHAFPSGNYKVFSYGVFSYSNQQNKNACQRERINDRCKQPDQIGQGLF